MIAMPPFIPHMSSPSPDKGSEPSGFGLPPQAEAPAAKGLNGLHALTAQLPQCGLLPEIEQPGVLRLIGFDVDDQVSRMRQENERIGRDYAPAVIIAHDDEWDALDDLAARLQEFSGDIVAPGGHVAFTGPDGVYSPDDLQDAADASGLTILVAELGRTGATVYRPGGHWGEFDRNIVVDDGNARSRCPGPGSIDFGN